QLSGLKVGDIIVSGIAENAPHGFLRKITAISKSGTEYTFTTEEVPLEEAFEDLDVDFTQQFSEADSLGRLTGNGFGINMPQVVLYDGDGNVNTTSDQIVINGSVNINPS